MDDPSNYILFISWILLVLCSGLISGSEVAFFSLSPSDLSKIKKGTDSKHKTIIANLQNTKYLLATILVANNIINIAIIILSSHILSQFENISIFQDPIFQIFIITAILLLFGEVLPKIFANRSPKLVAEKMGRPLYLLGRFLSPICNILIFFSNIIEKKSNKSNNQDTIENLSNAISITSKNEKKEDANFLKGIVQFGKTDVKQIMKSRLDVTAIEKSTPFKEVISIILKSGYSRIPVFEDNFDNIKGILHIKDLLPYLEENTFKWEQVLRKPVFVPESKKIDDLLKEIKEKKQHMIIVVDEYGGTSGIVTLEDIIEEIIGDISDEFDQEDVIYSKIEQGKYIFQGKVNLKDFYRIIQIDGEDFEKKKGEADTLAGFIIENYGLIPKKGQKYNFKHFEFIIEGANKKQIKSIKVHIKNPD